MACAWAAINRRASSIVKDKVATTMRALGRTGGEAMVGSWYIGT